MEDLQHLPESVARFFLHVSDATGVPNDQLRLLLCLLSAIVFGQIHRVLRSVAGKHVFSILVGVSFAYLLVGPGVLHMTSAAAVTYLLVRLLPPRTAALLCFLFNLAYLSAIHIHRMYASYLSWQMDYSLLQMMWTVKAVTFAYNVADGAAINKGELVSDNPKIHEWRKARALERIPSPLEYASYAFFYGGVLVGPCFECREYLEFTDLTIFKREGLSSAPPTLLPALKCVAAGLFVYGGVMIAGYLPVFGYVHTDEFLSHPSVLYKIGYGVVAVIFGRWKYYFAWFLAEAGCNSAGFGFSGRDKETGAFLWTRCTNANAWKVETARDVPTVTNNWNLGVNNWLKNYVYLRLEPSEGLLRALGGMKKATFLNFATKLTSAFWHGFYSGYYLFFLSAAVVAEFDTLMRRALWAKERNGQGKGGVVYIAKSVFAWLMTTLLVNWMGVSFMVLKASWALAYWSSTYYFGHVVCLAGILILGAGAGKGKPKAMEGPAVQQGKAD